VCAQHVETVVEIDPETTTSAKAGGRQAGATLATPLLVAAAVAVGSWESE